MVSNAGAFNAAKDVVHFEKSPFMPVFPLHPVLQEVTKRGKAQGVERSGWRGRKGCRLADVYHFQMNDQAHTERVALFQHDVNTDMASCIRRHITTGDPAGMSQTTYYDLRRNVADWLKIHPSAVIVVGSCRVGFTLKPKSRYRPFGPASDIDVAVVSDRWFNQIWDGLFKATHPNRDWVLTNKQGKRLGRDLYNGWITPSKLPTLPGFESAKNWAEAFAKMTREGICNRHAIRGRLYRDWKRLEQYQAHYVRLCRPI